MPKHLDCQQRAADWANDGVHGVPDRIYPWNFVRKKFHEIENTGNADDPRISEDFERLIVRRQANPVKVDGQSSDENRQVKIDAGKRGETETDCEEIEAFHDKNIVTADVLSCPSSTRNSDIREPECCSVRCPQRI